MCEIERVRMACSLFKERPLYTGDLIVEENAENARQIIKCREGSIVRKPKLLKRGGSTIG